MRDGWFQIDGVTNGPRTLDEQMRGLAPALAEARGKTVADFGTAEGLIALEFVKAGAKSVYACDYNEQMIATANAQREALGRRSSRVVFEHKDLNEVMQADRRRYDIVLALAIIHKMADPGAAARFMSDSAESLIVVRLPVGSIGVVKAKHYPDAQCDIRAIFAERGFTRERKEEGPRGEWVQYWRRG